MHVHEFDCFLHHTAMKIYATWFQRTRNHPKLKYFQDDKRVHAFSWLSSFLLLVWQCKNVFHSKFAQVIMRSVFDTILVKIKFIILLIYNLLFEYTKEKPHLKFSHSCLLKKQEAVIVNVTATKSGRTLWKKLTLLKREDKTPFKKIIQGLTKCVIFNPQIRKCSHSWQQSRFG